MNSKFVEANFGFGTLALCDGGPGRQAAGRVLLPVDHHPVVQLRDRGTDGRHEKEGQKGVAKAGNAAEKHARGEGDRDAHVLGVGLVHAGRMLGENRRQHDEGSSSREMRRPYARFEKKCF